MTFTFQNVWENRDAFIEACKKAGACKTQFKPLIEAKTKNEFMQVVYDNFNWICFKIEDFEPKFNFAFDFKNDFARVKLNGKWGFVKEDGSYLVKPKFDWARDFANGLALVKLKGKYGFINNNGSYLIEPNFKDAGCFSEGFARVKVNEKWGFIKTDGSYLIEPNFDWIKEDKNNSFFAKCNGKFYLIDSYGDLTEIK